ncbi:esterase/lipase family protein, partial [Chromohalobacter nigrandesensis]|uniref:esterase/lipase family protein n=1 Tax=Chromohalobacter nigrandesensis TaxID=119863 RepID=UPI001FF4D892
DSEFDALQPHLADYYRRVAGLSAEVAESRAERNVHTLGRFNFPVHACGYNWLQSNTDSAATLAKRVDEIIAGYRRARMTCDQAILVTHSMGGLVARYCSEVSRGNDVWCRSRDDGQA